MKRALFLSRGTAVWLLLTAAVCASAEPALAGHLAFKGQSLDADGLKAVLLGKKVTIGDTRAVIVIAKANPAQDAFLQAHVGMSTSQLQNHWRRLFMTGGGTAPKIVESADDVRKLLAETTGAVGVVDDGAAAGLVILGK